MKRIGKKLVGGCRKREIRYEKLELAKEGNLETF